MPSAAWRLVFLPLVLLAMLLAGSPTLPALQRALARAFAASPTAPSMAADLVPRAEPPPTPR